MAKAKTGAASQTVVYCGPTLPGVAKQYTVYKGALPEQLTAAIKKEPAIRELIIPLGKLADARRQLGSKSGYIYRLYKAVQPKN